MLNPKQATSFHKSGGDSGVKASVPAPSGNDESKASTAPTAPTTPTPGKFSIDVPDGHAEIRRDYIFEEYAVIAPKRHNRPFDFRGNDHPLIETASSPHLDDQKVIDNLKSPLGKQPVRVVENKFPAFTQDNPKAYGHQELVVDTPLSSMPTGNFSLESMQDVLATYQQRIRALNKMPHIKYVQVFKNDGHHAGASLAHAHTQIFALPLVPPRYQLRSDVVEAYVAEKGRNPYDDIIAFEKKEKSRVIASLPEAIAFTPYASTWSLEAWIMPARNLKSFADCSKQDILSIAKLLLPLLHKLTISELDYNFFIEEGLSSNQRWVLKIYGRDVVSPQGGLEVSTGIMINTIPPEAAAKWYSSPD